MRRKLFYDRVSFHGWQVGTCGIRRAAADGLIAESDERPDIALDDERRRYYRLTPLGRRVAAAEIARLESIVEMARAKKLVPRPRTA